MKKVILESDLENLVLSIMESLGYEIAHGDNEEYLPGGSLALRNDYKEVVLVDRLRDSLQRINPSATSESLEQAIKQVLASESQNLIHENERFHKMLVDGVDVAIRKDNEERYEKIWLFDFKDINNNEFLVSNQWTVVENNIERRPDVVIFTNGIPLVVMELKNLADENATIWDAYNQLQTYKEQIPTLFKYNEILVLFIDINLFYQRLLHGNIQIPIFVSVIDPAITGVHLRTLWYIEIEYFFIFYFNSFY